jgi:hypothetical protein
MVMQRKAVVTEEAILRRSRTAAMGLLAVAVEDDAAPLPARISAARELLIRSETTRKVTRADLEAMSDGDRFDLLRLLTEVLVPGGFTAAIKQAVDEAVKQFEQPKPVGFVRRSTPSSLARGSKLDAPTISGSSIEERGKAATMHKHVPVPAAGAHAQPISAATAEAEPPPPEPSPFDKWNPLGLKPDDVAQSGMGEALRGYNEAALRHPYLSWRSR